MGLLRGIFKSRDKPQNRTSGSAYTFILGNSTSGKRVNERSAMQMTAVLCLCQNFIRGNSGIATAPLQIYRQWW